MTTERSIAGSVSALAREAFASRFGAIIPMVGMFDGLRAELSFAYGSGEVVSGAPGGLVDTLGAPQLPNFFRVSDSWRAIGAGSREPNEP